MASKDPKFGLATPGLSDPATRAFAITPGTAALSTIPRYLYVGADGNIVVVDTTGNEVTLKGAKAGSVLPIRVTKVLASGTIGSPVDTTTATGIVGLY